jgi:hypothetical protein
MSRDTPHETRSKRRRRLTEFSQDQVIVHDYVSRRKRWFSVFLVWVAIVCVIVVAVWLRMASLPADEEVGVVNIDAAVEAASLPTQAGRWLKVPAAEVFGGGEAVRPPRYGGVGLGGGGGPEPQSDDDFEF